MYKFILVEDRLVMLRHTLSVLYEESGISARVQAQDKAKAKAKAIATARCEARCVGTWHVFLLSFLFSELSAARRFA